MQEVLIFIVSDSICRRSDWL